MHAITGDLKMVSSMQRLQRLKRAAGKIPQIASVRRESLDWSRLMSLYAGVRKFRGPEEFRLRGTEASSVRVWEHGDVHNVWAIFCGAEYQVVSSDRVVLDVGA